DGPHLFVIDARSMTLLKTLTLPAKKLEYLAINPRTHTLYQNLTDVREIAAIDSKTLTVKRLIKTPEIVDNHPLIFDAADNALIDVGENGTLAVYSVQGKLLHRAAFSGHVDQCAFDSKRRRLACFGSSIVLFKIGIGGAPRFEAKREIARGMHTGTIDPATGIIWAGWPTGSTSVAQAFRVAAAKP
ncbi:MAG TPA: hypothetical protein VMV73_05975, partial [Candidatus Dormibacteraeota bacterium]|nr:hypothetical protein [Candidatus Dormibacteraeota bacterium]